MSNNFEEIKLSAQMKENLSSLGYTSLTSIQEKVIPTALTGKDLIGQSRTGTGKTAAFLIPIIESISANQHVQALVLAPTRELALQTREEGVKLTRGTDLSVVAVYGGESIERQIYQLKRKAEIVVGTPGRVLDHLNRKTLRLEKLRFFVLDEVDEMLKRGFIDDIRTIAKLAKNDHLQTLFFSATVSNETRELADSFLRNPVFINNVSRDDVATRSLISQHYLAISDPRSRISNLVNIIHFQDPELAIIFAGTKRMVDIISDELGEEGFSVEKIHSDLSQSKRTSVYNSFKNKKVRFLVATDIAARGIDIEGISHVYNYDFPQDPEFYIHRIGRTGRAGLSGQSIIILNEREVRRQVPFLERLTGERIKPIYRPSPEEINEIVEDKALLKVSRKIEEVKDKELSEKAHGLLQHYSSEQILRGFISNFIIKRKPVREANRNEFSSPGGSRSRPSFERRGEFKPAGRQGSCGAGTSHKSSGRGDYHKNSRSYSGRKPFSDRGGSSR